MKSGHTSGHTVFNKYGNLEQGFDLSLRKISNIIAQQRPILWKIARGDNLPEEVVSR